MPYEESDSQHQGRSLTRNEYVDHGSLAEDLGIIPTRFEFRLGDPMSEQCLLPNQDDDEHGDLQRDESFDLEGLLAGPSVRRDRVWEAAKSYREAMVEMEGAEEELEVAEDALAEAECDGFDAVTRAKRRRVEEAEESQKDAVPNTGFGARPRKQRSDPCSEAESAVDEAAFECARLESVVRRTRLRCDRAQRRLKVARTRLLYIAAGE